MAIRKILRMGNPQLRLKANTVEQFGDDRLVDLIGDMMDTKKAFDGAGLAAPQIGVPLRIVVFGICENLRYPDAPFIPLTVLINPDITPTGEEMNSDWEGCLSLPGMRGLVPRYTRIRYRGVDVDGREIDREAEGFHARVVQHECDHLDGILYPDRIRDGESFGFIEELQAAGLIGDDISQ